RPPSGPGDAVPAPVPRVSAPLAGTHHQALPRQALQLGIELAEALAPERARPPGQPAAHVVTREGPGGIQGPQEDVAGGGLPHPGNISSRYMWGKGARVIDACGGRPLDSPTLLRSD